MTRHSKNNTANPIFTYHERRMVKDFNTLNQRLGSDSMRKCEQCWLCLSTAIKPVCNSFGYVFCKECILKCFSKQMEDYKYRLQEWEATVEQIETVKQHKHEAKCESQKRKLINESVYGVSTVKASKRDESSSVNQRNKESTALEGNFWLSGNTTSDKGTTRDGKLAIPAKPKPTMKCPITGKPMKVKELVDIHPDTTRESDDPASDTIWICAISQKPISHHGAVLDRKSGKVMLKQYVAVSENDDGGQFIPLIPGGTGFCAHNNVSASKYRPALL